MSKTSVVHSDPEILSGIPVFVGSRVPFQNLCRSVGRRKSQRSSA